MGSLDKALRLRDALKDTRGRDGVWTFIEVDDNDRSLMLFSSRGRITIPFDDLEQLVERLDAINRSR